MAVRGASRADVRRTIVEEMSAEGWRVSDPESADAHEVSIEIIERGEWIAIHDVRDRLPTAWAERIAHALGVVGISGRSWSDQGLLTLARFDGKKPSGKLKVSSSDHEGPIQAPFLVDLAPAKNRTKLRAGVTAGEVLLDDAFDKLLALAGLPESYDRYMEDTGGVIVSFHRPAQPVKPDVRVRNVGFETSIHVFGVEEAKVIAAINSAVAGKELPRQVFVREWQGWTSFGEVVEEDDAVGWGKLLSKKLAAPVLEVFEGDDGAELRAFVGGKAAGRLKVTRRDEVVVAEKAFLAPFGGKKTVKARVTFNPFTGTGEHRNAVEEIASAIGLDKPILTGAIKGRVLSFGALVK